MNRKALAQLRFDLSEQVALQRYLVANLAVSGAALDHWATHFNRACHWYAHLLGQGMDRVPFFVAHDVGLLLLQGRGFRFRLLTTATSASGAEDTRRRQVAYENRVLNRLLALPWFEMCVETLDEIGARDDVIGMLLERLLSPLIDAPLPRVDASAHQIRAAGLPGSTTPSLARASLAELASPVDPDRPVDLADLLASDDPTVPAATDLLDAIAAMTAETFQGSSLKGLIGNEDVFVIRHFDILGTRAQRMIARQLTELENELGAAPPPPAQWRKETPQVSVDLDDAGYFPQGGLDELATRGSIENLVRSELVYLDSDQKIDLFTLRFVEGELLYYTRDEGQLMRRSRAVHIALELDDVHEVLFPGHPARLSTLMRAATQRLVDDLCALFEGEGDSLQITLHAVGEKRADVAAYWRVRFRERIDRGEILVAEHERPIDLSQVPSPYLVAGRITSFIHVGERAPIRDTLRSHHQRAGLEVYWVTLDEERPPVEEDAPAPQADWIFRVALVSEDFLGEMRAARTALVWRTFGAPAPA